MRPARMRMRVDQDEQASREWRMAKWVRASLPQFNMQRQAILKYLKDIMLLRTHYTTNCRKESATETERQRVREGEEERESKRRATPLK